MADRNDWGNGQAWTTGHAAADRTARREHAAAVDLSIEAADHLVDAYDYYDRIESLVFCGLDYGEMERADYIVQTAREDHEAAGELLRAARSEVI